MTPLKEHQQGDIEFIRSQGRVLLANEPGLGKSRSAIASIDSAARKLIIAPGLVITGGTWEDELAKWASDPATYTVAPYSMLNDRVRTGNGSGTKPVQRLRSEYTGHWDAVVVDEAHYTKGRKTSWTWAVQQICKNANVVVTMTGTPIPNWSHELFTILQTLYPEESKPGTRFGSFWRWAGEWFDTTPTRFSNGNPVVGEMKACLVAKTDCLSRPPDDPCEHYLAFTQANLGERYRRVLRRDCLDLPPFTEQTVKVPLDTAGKRYYRELKKDFVTNMDGEEVVAWSQGAVNVMLDKITTSPWLLNPEGEPRGGKLEQLRFDLESRTRPTLVFAHYRSTVDACVAVANSTGRSAASVHGGTSDKDRAAAISAFKAGRLDVLVGSLETLAEGLTLTVADTAIFVEKSYKPSRNEQAVYRIYRMGQERAVTVLDYVCPSTVDSKKRDLLATKNDRQMRTLTAAQFAALL